MPLRLKVAARTDRGRVRKNNQDSIFAGRIAIKLSGKKTVNENNLTPWAVNGLLKTIFAAEGPWLKAFGFPIGVSLLAIVRKPS